MFETASNTNERTTQKCYGKYPGLVLANTAPQGSDHRGELLVEVSGILEDLPGSEDQRPIQIVAKPCFPPGFFFIPEIGDRVWVEFAAGDINTPVWTGVWYPRDMTPRTIAGGAPTESQKIIRTLSGQVIQSDDGDGSLTLRDQNGNTITMDSNGITLIAGDLKLIMDRNEGKIILDFTTLLLGSEDSATHPLVLGDVFSSLWNMFINHTHPTSMGPTGTPVPPGAQLLQGSQIGTSISVKV